MSAFLYLDQKSYLIWPRSKWVIKYDCIYHVEAMKWNQEMYEDGKMMKNTRCTLGSKQRTKHSQYHNFHSQIISLAATAIGTIGIYTY